jgi:hypothetical protein
MVGLRVHVTIDQLKRETIFMVMAGQSRNAKPTFWDGLEWVWIEERSQP